MIRQYDAAPTISSFMNSSSLVRIILGPVGPVSGDTEFLTPTGWKRVDAFRDGDTLAEWNKLSGRLTWRRPKRYIVQDADTLLHFRNKNTLSMVLSDEHRCPVYDWNGRLTVKSARQLAVHPSRHRIPVNFTPAGNGIALSDDEIRLAVAIKADGHMPPRGSQCVVCVRKERKKSRMRALLDATGTNYNERDYETRETETHFVFQREDLTKQFDPDWWNASQRQLEIILAECLLWDGLADHVEHRYYTANKLDADFIQYAAHATGRRAHISKVVYEQKNWKPQYIVQMTTPGSVKASVMLRGDTTKISRVPAPNGKKYCFETHTGFWVARHDDKLFITGNSGKTTGCLIELARRSVEQDPGYDGMRRTRWAVSRQTLQQIKNTVLKEFYNWLGPITEFKVSDSTISLKSADVISEIHLIPLEDERDQRRLLSMQLTGAWINEFPEIDPALIPPLIGRLGRFPPVATWHGLIMDGNFPTIGSEWHRLLETNRPANWDVYKQPSGLADDAENLNFLLQTKETIKLPVDHPIRVAQGRSYYNNQMQGQSEAWIKRYVLAQYGDDPSGTAVFRTTFKPSVHVADALEPMRGRLLVVGQDFGRDPVSILCQIDPSGKLLVLEEVAASDIGLELHITSSLRPVLIQERYLGCPIAIVGDPSGVAKSSHSERNSFDILRQAGFAAVAAPTNDPDKRIQAVESLLLRLNGVVIDGGKCPNLVRAMSGGYKFSNDTKGLRKIRPDKDEPSHYADALQYVCLVIVGGMAEYVASRTVTRQRQPPKFSAAAWT